MSTQSRCTGSSSQLNSEYGSPKPHQIVMATSAVPRTERRKSRGCESGWVSVTTPSLRYVLAEVLGERRSQRGRGVGCGHHVDAETQVACRLGRHGADAGDSRAAV